MTRLGLGNIDLPTGCSTSIKTTIDLEQPFGCQYQMRSRQACLLNIISRHFDEAGIGAVAHRRKTCSKTIINVQPDISKYSVNMCTI